MNETAGLEMYSSAMAIIPATLSASGPVAHSVGGWEASGVPGSEGVMCSSVTLTCTVEAAIQKKIVDRPEGFSVPPLLEGLAYGASLRSTGS